MKDVAGVDCIRIGNQPRSLSDDIIPSPQISGQLRGGNRSTIVARFRVSDKDGQCRFDIPSERFDAGEINLTLLVHRCLNPGSSIDRVCELPATAAPDFFQHFESQ
ncbi:MAG: hypothetical protein J0H40_15275 [Rhizobiales bacterium]|nr:hypothetical protein [Hyphomicrobiales bacterium]